MTKARTLADMISDGVIGTTELADDVITPVKLDETGSYIVAGLTANGNTVINERLDVNKQGEAFRLRTGDAATQNYISIGRTGEDARITMSGGANNAIQTSAAGDLVIGANNNLLMGRIGSPYINLNSTGVVLNELGGADKDFRVESDSNTHALFVDAGAEGGQGAVGIGTSSVNRKFVVSEQGANGIEIDPNISGYSEIISYNRSTSAYTRLDIATDDLRLYGASGGITLNDSGQDSDFRVESNNNANMLFVDAGLDNVGIGKAPGSGQGALQIAPQVAATNYYRPAGNYAVFGDSGGNGEHDWVYLSGSYTDTDKSVGFAMQDYNGNFGNYAGSYIRTNQAKVRIGHFVGGANSGTAPSLADNAIFDTAGGAVFNERGETGDFRVESDTNANALFIDAGYNSGKGAAIFGSNSAPETGTDYYIAASMLKFSDAEPVMATGATWSAPSVPSNRQTQANRWRFQGFTLPYHGSNAYRADSSYSQFVCELPNGGPSGKSNLEVFEIGFNRGWNGGFYMVEVYESYYTNGGYKKYLFHGGYDPSFTLFENYGNNSISLNVLSEGPFQKGTSSVSSSTVDQSYYRKTVRASYGAYWGGMVVLTVPSWQELTLNAAEVDNGAKIRLLNPQ